MIRDKFILVINFDVGHRKYTYYDYNQLIFDMNYDLKNLILMCKNIRIDRILEFVKED